jgi:hypothetical protein
LISTALVRIRVGVLVERRKATSPWADVLYRPVGVLPGVPAATPWTVVSSGADVTTFYAGEAVIELHRTETAGYRDNLASGAPSLWVSLRATVAQDRLEVLLVTADPAEGEALTGAGDDLVDAVPMPPAINSIVADFVATHHVERAFRKRQRDRSTPQADAGPAQGRENPG